MPGTWNPLVRLGAGGAAGGLAGGADDAEWSPLAVRLTIFLVSVLAAVVVVTVVVGSMKASKLDSTSTLALAPAHTTKPASTSVPAPTSKPTSTSAPAKFWDDAERQPTPQPRDEPRWPLGPYPAEHGFWGPGQYGPGGFAGGHWFRPGDLPGSLPSAFADYDYPTAGIMRRPTDPVGPWERAGALVGSDGSTVLPFFARQRGRDSWNQWNYRTVMDKVPLDIGGTRSDWVGNGDWVDVPGVTGSFSVQLYEEYR